MKDKKTIYSMIMAIVMLVASITFISFGYMGSRSIINGVSNLSGDVLASGSLYNFTFSGDVSLNLNVTLDQLSSVNALPSNETYIDGEVANVIMNLTADYGKVKGEVSCDYKVVYTPENVYNSSSEAAAANLNELYIIASNNGNIYKKSVDNLSDKYVLHSGVLTTTKGNVSENWSFNYRYMNLNVDQGDAMRQQPSCKISIEVSKCYSIKSEMFDCNDNSFTCKIANLYNGDGVNDLYLHDGSGSYVNASLEAGDNSIRYAGANPDNFVCFGSDDELCPSDNLYRIIGVFDGRVKLIKWDYAVVSSGPGNTADYSGLALNLDGSNNLPNYRGVLSGSAAVPLYYRNNVNDYANTNVTSPNEWDESRFNIININTNYISTLNTKYVNMIDYTNWNINKVSSKNFAYANNAKTAFDDFTKSSAVTMTPTKIGLMYTTDYYYAASPEKWSLAGYSASNYLNQDGNYGPEYDYESAIDTNWMYMGLDEWTMDSINSDSIGVFIKSSGCIMWTYVYSYYYAYRPVFYLKSDVVYSSGNGTKLNPYRLLEGTSSDDNTDACQEDVTLANCIKSQYTSDGNLDLYYHDGQGTYVNASLEAEDDSYRYAGANPDNYVCFGTEYDICPNDNLYRIIGVFNNKVKLIKADYATGRWLGTDGDYSNTSYTLNIPTAGSASYKGSLSGAYKLGAYYRNDTNDYANTNTTSVNDWSESRLNTINLNTNYLNNIGSKYADMISSTTWNVRKVNIQNFAYANTAKTAYGNKNSSSVDYVAKVGLMYVTDYYYAAAPEKWSLAGYSASNYLTQDGNYGPEYDYRAAIDSNWMHMGLYEWTMDTVGSTMGYLITYNNLITWQYVYSYVGAVRPVFYLDEEVLYKKGNGSALNPYRIA